MVQRRVVDGPGNVAGRHAPRTFGFLFFDAFHVKVGVSQRGFCFFGSEQEFGQTQ